MDVIRLHGQLPYLPAVHFTPLPDQLPQPRSHRPFQDALSILGILMLGHEDQVVSQPVGRMRPGPVARLLPVLLFLLGGLPVAVTHATDYGTHQMSIKAYRRPCNRGGCVAARFNPAMNCGAACSLRCSALLDRLAVPVIPLS